MNFLKKASALFLLLLLSLSLFTACGDSDEVPGMKLISDPAKEGYRFYLPEEYTVDRANGFPIGYLSVLDKTSISCYVVYPEEASIAEYVENHLDQTKLDGFALENNYEQTVDGRNAYTYEYKYTRTELPDAEKDPVTVDYKTMQLYIPFSDDLKDGVVILTYTGKKTESVTGLIAYDDHMEDFKKVIQVFSFVDAPKRAEATQGNPMTEGAPAGMQLASNDELSKYSLYVPLDWVVDQRTGISSAYRPSTGTSVSATFYYPDSGISTTDDYVGMILKEYRGFYDKVEQIPLGKDENGENIMHETLTVAGFHAYRYDFSAEYDGVSYRITRIFIQKDSGFASKGLYNLILIVKGATPEEANAQLAAEEETFKAILDAFRFD